MMRAKRKRISSSASALAVMIRASAGEMEIESGMRHVSAGGVVDFIGSGDVFGFDEAVRFGGVHRRHWVEWRSIAETARDFENGGGEGDGGLKAGGGVEAGEIGLAGGEVFEAGGVGLFVGYEFDGAFAAECVDDEFGEVFDGDGLIVSDVEHVAMTFFEVE